MSHQKMFWLWVGFTIIFGALGVYNLIAAFGHPPHFEYAWASDGADMVLVPGTAFTPAKTLSGELKTFVTTFNDFVDAQARDAMWANLAGVVGNLIAAVTSALAAIVEWKVARRFVVSDDSPA